MAALADASRATAFMAKLQYMARTRYGIRAQDAHDIFQESVATYLKVHTRYPLGDNHFGLLVGIYQRKALKFLDWRHRDGRMGQRYVNHLHADRPTVVRGEDPGGDVAQRVIRQEDAALILAALESLHLDSRELLLALAEGRATRLELIQALAVNRNTFDTRLRASRLKFKKILEQSGVLEEAA